MTQIMPIPNDISIVSKIVSNISKKYHLEERFVVRMRTYCAAVSDGAQKPPSLPKLTDAVYILAIEQVCTFEFTLQLN